jgi:hypothetical protein
MGNARYDEDTFRSYSQTHSLSTASQEEVFRQSNIHELLNPANIRIRESRDSAANPASTAIAVFGDVTGSMGRLAGEMVKEGMDSLMRQLYATRPVTDPHIMFGAFGDILCDHAPLQASQFEADIRIVEQLRLAYLEGGGGGNGGESASLPWYFMAHKTAIDCWEKRQKKGYLFTYSDESIHNNLPADTLAQVMGGPVEGPFDSRGVLRQVSQRYEVFHLIVNHGNSPSSNLVEDWERLLHNRVIIVADPKRMPDVILATIRRNEGVSTADLTASLPSDVQTAVTQAMRGVGRFVDLT